MHDIVQPELFAGERLAVDAVGVFSEAPAEKRGAIHTRPEVAEFILDAVGWKESEPLESLRLLEPSAGEGDFLLPAARRLIARVKPDTLAIRNCLRAVEVSRNSLATCRKRVEELLAESGWTPEVVRAVADSWIVHDDFLSAPFDTRFSHVVGNPPYIRLENLPKDLLRAYRARWRSLFDRADLYVAFIERSLGLLSDGGRLGFICADRWMKNRYGAPLRGIVADGFHLESYVDFTGCPAFFDEVDAYPAVTVIRKGKGDATQVAFRPKVTKAELGPLSDALSKSARHPQIQIMTGVCRGTEPWLFSASPGMGLIRRMETKYPAIEDAACKVGIGVATGADAIFIGKYAELDVEPSRKLPLITTKDIRSGSVEWGGLFVLNPFEDDGAIVELDAYPAFREFVMRHRSALERRNVAGRTPHAWFRTIDRIHTSLTCTHKLLIPDIKGTPNVVMEDGRYYPHHNLYYVTSNTWDLHVLQMILSSRVAHAFIAAYSPRMRGNFLRFQAQYLRKIRLPNLATMSATLKRRALEASRSSLPEERDLMVRELYGLQVDEWEALGRFIVNSEDA